MNLKDLDLFKWSEKLPTVIRLKALSRALDIAIPFNSGLGMEITEMTPERVVLTSKERRRRRNHVGSSHACFLALLSEYPAGLVVTQHYPMKKYRIIISELKIEYFKQGRGTLTSTAQAPSFWPELTDGEGFIDMQTEITSVQGELVSRCTTRWQVKEWERVRKPAQN